MKILHLGKFYPPHKGGMETHLENLATEQAKHVDVEVLVANDSRERCESFESGFKVTRVAVFGSIASSPLTWGFSREIVRANPDVVHIHAPNPIGMGAFLRSGTQASLVITHHADITGRNILKKIISPIWVKAMERADAIIVSSSANISSELQPYRDKVKVIPYGIDFSAMDVDAAADIPRPCVLFVGRLVPYKGVEYLIAAMRNINADLVIIGTGPEEPFLKEVAKAQGIKARFLGNVKLTAPYYRAADIFVLPSCSTQEAFGLVQLEAMHCGVPVINTALASGVPEVSLHNVTGLTVKPANIPEMHTAIDYLMRYPELRTALGAAGKTRAAEFTVESMTTKTLEIYQELIGNLPVHPRTTDNNSRASR